MAYPPGQLERLSPEEWEKMKAHPLIGGEMLSRMNFPDSVVALVKAHHEKWDGTGYPKGLFEQKIPIGARIISAVDCLDALASDRPYRKALPLRQAMDMVRIEKERSFDPRVVAALERRFEELEQLFGKERGISPGAAIVSPAASLRADLANLEGLPAASGSSEASALNSIVAARHETQGLQTLASHLAGSLGIDKIGEVIHQHLGQMISFDTLVVYISRGAALEPILIRGGYSHLFSRRSFLLEDGLSGQCALRHMSILNGDPSLERCYVSDSDVFCRLQSALAVPLASRDGIVGVLTLYRPDRSAFNRDDLRLAEAASGPIGLAVESAVRYQEAENLAILDHLTGIPNSRALALHLARELSRAVRENSTIGVLVCDLDGFKQVNDRFGHLKGNEVLQLVANRMRETCRGSDYVARIGGDEFVIVVPGLKEELCPSYVDRLRTVAQDVGLIACGELCLSMSVGTAIYPSDGMDAESLLTKADGRMYGVKQQQKRNPTRFHEEHDLLAAASRLPEEAVRS